MELRRAHMPWTIIGLRLGEPKQACLNLEPSCPERRPALHFPALWTGSQRSGPLRPVDHRSWSIAWARLDQMRLFSSNVWKRGIRVVISSEPRTGWIFGPDSGNGLAVLHGQKQECEPPRHTYADMGSVSFTHSMYGKMASE